MNTGNKGINPYDRIFEADFTKLRKERNMKINLNDNADRKEFIGQIIDIFEDFLTDKCVEIENEERDEALYEDNGLDFVNIFGKDYDNLASDIMDMLNEWRAK